MILVVVQIVVAIALGAAIGLEREFGAQPAGLRTHMLVSLGSALFTLAGVALSEGDPARIAAQVVAGVGFLGGGAIFREGVNIRGLTTAASLWVTAAIGLAVGLRQWLAAIGATLLAMGVLWLVKLAERDWLPRRHLAEFVLFMAPDAPLDEVAHAAGEAIPHASVRRIDYAASDQSITFTARIDTDITLSQLAEQLRRLPGVQGVQVDR